MVLNEWVHWAVVRDGNICRMYRNGIQVDAQYLKVDSVTYTVSTSCSGPFAIGKNSYTKQNVNGYMDEVRISNICRYPDGKTFLPNETAGTLVDSQTLLSTTTTAESTATKASILIQTEDNVGTATVNTDLKAGVSRDALNYVDTTLAKVSTWGSGNVYAANDVEIPGTVNHTVTVASSKFVIDGTSQPTLTLTEGYTYKFDTSDSTNATHLFNFSTTADGTYGSGVDYTTGVTYNGTSGSAGAYTQIVVAASAPTLYYWCHHHASMGGTANTPAEAATTSMRYRVDTKNQSASKVTRIHGTSLAWS